MNNKLRFLIPEVQELIAHDKIYAHIEFTTALLAHQENMTAEPAFAVRRSYLIYQFCFAICSSPMRVDLLFTVSAPEDMTVCVCVGLLPGEVIAAAHEEGNS